MYAGGARGKTLASPYAWFISNSAGQIITGEKDWWTISPSGWTSASSYAHGYAIQYNGYPMGYDVAGVDGEVVRPVISLDTCVYVKGTGTPTDPYVVDESASTC